MKRDADRHGNFVVALSQVLRERREQIHMSQTQLAEKAGLHRTYISEVERGARNITIETICRLAEALDTTVVYLIQSASAIVESCACPIEILLAEDNPADIHLITRSLDKARVPTRVNTVKEGTEVMAYLNRKGKYAQSPVPDLILLDLNLPRKNGREVLAELKASDQLKQIPVVILTTSGNQRDIAATYKLHANSFITKPVDPEQFQQAVTNMVEYWVGCAKLPV